VRRLQEAFRKTKGEGRAAFVAYVTCGDPTLGRTKELVRAFTEAGVDIVEFGVPFSDPMADGVANQEAANRALAQGVTLDDVLMTIRDLRAEACEMPVVLFTYYNPVFAYGVERFARDAASAGADGVLLVDVPVEEAGDCKGFLDAAGLATIFLVAPTTEPARLPNILRRTTGFVYYVSRTGVTGERESIRRDIRSHVEAIRAQTDLPVAVGFGISTPAHVREVAGLADGVVVGSAIVRRIGAGGDTQAMVTEVTAFVRSLTAALRDSRTSV